MRKLALLVLVGCGGGKQDKPPAPAPAPKAPADAAPVATLDPATFTPLALAPTIAGYRIAAPPGASITPDAPPRTGVDIAKGAWSLHVWKGTIGTEREAMRTLAEMQSQAYVETSMDERGLALWYSLDGKLGYIQALSGGEILCGTSAPVADQATLDAVRQTCATLTKSK